MTQTVIVRVKTITGRRNWFAFFGWLAAAGYATSDLLSNPSGLNGWLMGFGIACALVNALGSLVRE